MNNRILLLLPLLLLLACSNSPITGMVVQKEIEPERTWSALQPIPQTRCAFNGQMTVCTTTYLYVPTTHYDDKDWVLVVRSSDGKTHRVYVEETHYLNTEIGDYYREGGG